MQSSQRSATRALLSCAIRAPRGLLGELLDARRGAIGDATLLGSAYANIERAKATDFSRLEHLLASASRSGFAIARRLAVH